MLEVGEIAPGIDALASNGKRFVLSHQTGLCTVVYFFPKAFTPGCTQETKAFVADYTELQLAGANIVGISIDDETTQCNFAEALKTPFPLIGDYDGAISRAFKVKWLLLPIAKRVTYVIGTDMTILAAFRWEFAIDKHRHEVLRFIQQYTNRARSLSQSSLEGALRDAITGERD